ncbi:MAG: SpoIID/LytB domain-containing protein [Candidatus Omnitrophica bacterium]|nr:SpoIID/LytB domain-containing protein [Candidatus Omnitrophota bacterium]
MKRDRAHSLQRTAYTIIALLIAAIVIAVQPPVSSSKSKDNILRVCVLKDSKSLTLTIKGSYKIFTLNTNELIDKGKNLKMASVLPLESGLSISGKPLKIYGIKIMPKRDTSVSIGKRTFRGNIDIIRTKNKRLLVINQVDLEDYLKGVLYHEVSHWWPIETLKAQAIAARAYALYQKSVRRESDYDLTSDIYSQVYGGRGSEKIRTNRAVDLTRGKVLTYRDKIFPTYYHATCGGRTEDASNLWDLNLPPLKGVRCSFCRFSPHYNWEYEILLSQLERELNLAGYDLKGLIDVKIKKRRPSKRVKDLVFISDGKEMIIPAKDFRLAIGPNRVRSTNFALKVLPLPRVKRGKNDRAFFKGYGWGHGAGMCQWGAFFLGLKRYKAEGILRYYYPGTRISNIKIMQ